MRILGALLSLVLLAPTVGASVATVDIQQTECAGTETGCVLVRDEGESEGLGDDRTSARLGVARIGVTVDPPGPGRAALRLDPSEMRIEHPVYRTLNATWPQLNGSRPQGIREYVSFESRPLYKPDENGTERPSDEWGVSVTLRTPIAVFPWRGGRDANLFVACWDWCEKDGGTLLFSDEDGIEPFPYDVTAGEDSETVGERVILTPGYWVTSCYVFPGPCESTAVFRPTFHWVAAMYVGAAPAIGAELFLNETVVSIGNPGAPPGSPPASPARNEAERARIAAASAERDPGASGPESTPLSGGSIDVPRPGTAEQPRDLVGPGLRSSAVPGLSTRPMSLLPFLVASLAATALVAFAFALYHRIARRTALAQETRQRIHDLLVAEPGLRLGTLARRLGYDYTTVRHHVRLLRELGLVAGIGPGQLRWYAVGATTPAAVEAARVVSTPSVRAVRDLVVANGAMEQSAIARALGFAPSTVSEAVARLVEARLVETVHASGRSVVRPSSLG